MKSSMRFVTFLATLIFSITLADANQQVLLRVQWQQLELQNAFLKPHEKLQRVQDLSAFIAVQSMENTHVGKTPYQVFKTGTANEAELAFAKWMMYVDLGFDPEQFRLIYLQQQESQESRVWLAMYDSQDSKIITTNQIVDQDELNTILLTEKLDIISVMDPNLILNSRINKRQTEDQLQDTMFL